MIVVFDVSELKNAQRAIVLLNHGLEDKVTERTAQLAAANKDWNLFLIPYHTISGRHCGGIDGWSLALLEDYGSQLDEQAHKYLDRVRAETQRMGELIDDMLKLSRVSRAEVKLASVNLSELAETITKRIKEENPRRHLSVVIEPGLITYGDENLLEIMLANCWIMRANSPVKYHMQKLYSVKT